MLRVSIDQAKPGMVLAMAVYNPRVSSRLLLRPGAELESSTIERLIELRLPEIWIQYPNMEMVSKFVSPKIQESRAHIVSEVASAFELAGKDMHAKLEYNKYQQAMGLLMARLIDDPDAAVFIGEIADAGSPAVRHGANVGYLCMLMGLKLGFYLLRERSQLSPRLAKDITSLGVAAMLHDVGMTRLKASTLERWAREHNDTDPEWREHVKIGYQMVRGQVEPSAAAAVFHHHQRFDGSGFPTKANYKGEQEGLKGSKIHIFARILLVADLYDRLVNPAYSIVDSDELNAKHPPVYALHTLIHEPYRSWVDPIVLHALFHVCPAYAPGSEVVLSDGMKGVVVDWDPRDPCRPTVLEMSRFEDDDHVRVVNLRQNKMLQIVESEGHDVRSYNFYPEHGVEFDIRKVERDMNNGAFELLEREKVNKEKRSKKNGKNNRAA